MYYSHYAHKGGAKEVKISRTVLGTEILQLNDDRNGCRLNPKRNYVEALQNYYEAIRLEIDPYDQNQNKTPKELTAEPYERLGSIAGLSIGTGYSATPDPVKTFEEWARPGHFSRTIAKGPDTNTLDLETHADAHDFDSHTIDLEEISRKVFSGTFRSTFHHLSLLSGMYFHGSRFYNYEARPSDPTHIGPSAQVVWPIVGHTIGALVFAALMLFAGWFHYHKAAPKLAWFQDVESMLNHHLAGLLGLGGHMYRTNWGIGHRPKDILEAIKGYLQALNHCCSSSYVFHAPYPYLATDYGTQLSVFTHHMWIGGFIVGASAHAAILYGAHFVWAFSLMFLFSGRGYWQELIESIVWAHNTKAFATSREP
ncbi:hypothetical protein HAX54_025450 [Datura stramonium]|uniref:Uncharacterized protein n=1 Tax=Datura stramonium TaxID=4076 RepID=A0ABS8UZF4_DATST|nr:hypothetical protein [Datura stramonium]